MASEPSKLAAALAKVQAELKPVARNVEGQVGNRKRKYADLAAVSAEALPLLGSNGLSFTAWPTLDDGRFVLSYSLLHDSGEERTGTYPLPASGSPQQIGAAITYARRYALCAVTGVAPEGEDDDAAGIQEVHMDRAGRGPERYGGWDRPSEPPVPGPRPGPDHERLRHEPPPEDRWDGEDHWKDQPPGELPHPPPANGKPRTPRAKMSHAQAIAVHFKRLGVTDNTERLVKTTVLAGRDELLEHTADLDDATQARISGELSKCKDRAALDELLAAKRAEATQ